MKILSIDVWASPEGWLWNDWHTVGNIEKADFEKIDGKPRKILKWFRDNGYLSEESKGLLSIEDDQNSILICRRHTGQPLYAIEYGPEY